MKLFLLTFLITYPFSLCMYETTIVSAPDEFSMLGNLVNGTYNKPILRYGFHRTAECRDFNKAFICIQKCLDFHYDIAYADKNCYCTCYTKKDKPKYVVGEPGSEQKWKLGAPTTKIPAWAQKQSTEQHNPIDLEEHTDTEGLNGNETDTVESNHTLIETGNSTETGVIDVNIADNSTKSDNATAVENPEPNETNTNATVVGNATVPQNTTA